jgi:hypothetical protein
MPPRIGRSAPKVASTTAPRPAAAPKPAATAATAATWGAKGAAKARTPALGALNGTFHAPEQKALGKADVAGTIAGVKVKRATVAQFNGLTSARQLQTRTTHVEFGALTRPQFDALKAEFGGKSAVKYDAARAYSAVDFLPPALQALVNKDLDTGKFVEIKGSKKLADEMMMGELVTIGATPNCHGTAWEAMRQYQGTPGPHVQLAYGDAQNVGDRYGSEFDAIASAKPGEKLELKNVKPGDVVSFSRHDAQFGDMELLHSAVYVGGGLFFEKPDTESDEYGESPYRLVTLDQVLAPIKDFLSEEPSLTARRPKAALPAPAEAFSAASDDVAKLEKLLNKRGETVGRPLTIELIMGMGGGVRGMAFNAVVTKRVETDASGLGVIR